MVSPVCHFMTRLYFENELVKEKENVSKSMSMLHRKR